MKNFKNIFQTSKNCVIQSVRMKNRIGKNPEYFEKRGLL